MVKMNNNPIDCYLVDKPALIATLARLKPLFKALGITRVANVTGLDNLGLPVALCVRPNSKSLSVSQGKGLSWEVAQVSAIMESIEGYHIENPPKPQLWGNYHKLRHNFPLLDPAVFTPGKFQLPTTLEWEIAWIRGFDIVSQQHFYLPQVLTNLDITAPQPDYAFFSVSTNGLAAGNTLDQAICHGIHEVIERDCSSKFLEFSAEQRNKRQLDLTSIDSPIINTLIKQFSAANIDITLWDISTSLGIPAFRCILRDDNILRGLNAFLGCSANVSKEKALIAALVEAAQSRLTLIVGSRDDTFPREYERQKKAFARPVEKIKGGYSYQAGSSLAINKTYTQQLEYLLQRLTAHDYQRVLVVDHTKEELNIPVAHVFIPGMQCNEHAI